MTKTHRSLLVFSFSVVAFASSLVIGQDEPPAPPMPQDMGDVVAQTDATPMPGDPPPPNMPEDMGDGPAEKAKDAKKKSPKTDDKKPRKKKKNNKKKPKQPKKKKAGPSTADENAKKDADKKAVAKKDAEKKDADKKDADKKDADKKSADKKADAPKKPAPEPQPEKKKPAPKPAPKKPAPKPKPKPKRTAYLTEEAADADYALMGEYKGNVRLNCRTHCLGLQVYALGGGKFAAAAYKNGLPGSTNCASERIELQGQREGDQVKLSGEEMTVTVFAHRASVHCTRGCLAGCLRKIKRTSRTMHAAPPCNAMVLFRNGVASEHFKNAQVDEHGFLKMGTEFLTEARDFQLHLEFKLPYMPDSTGQQRGNSGLYIHSRYEVQMLDSFGLSGEFNECGALYRYQKPNINMALPPLQWQTYDITFRSARFDDEGKKIKNACITVRHNGVLIHNNFELDRKTGAGQKEGPNVLPIKLQNHSDPVRYRNIWMVDLEKNPCRPVCQPKKKSCRLFDWLK